MYYKLCKLFNKKQFHSFMFKDAKYPINNIDTTLRTLFQITELSTFKIKKKKI